MTGGDLQVSGWSRVYSANVFTHHQFAESGPLSAEHADDYYSPVQPQRYIDLRILPSIANEVLKAVEICVLPVM